MTDLSGWSIMPGMTNRQKILLRITCIPFLILSLAPALQAELPGARAQWTPALAWAWNDRVGMIKGFNELGRPYPGITDQDVMRQGASLGYNSFRTGDYFRSWLKSPDQTKQRLHRLLDQAQANGMTVTLVILWGSPSIPGGDDAVADPNAKVWQQLHDYITDIAAEFRDDKRIALWDVFNEPGFGQKGGIDLQVAAKLMVWAREAGASQPVTSSVAWMGPKLSPERIEIEKLEDIHNFHLYDCSTDQMGALAAQVEDLKKVSDRPIVCTECLARPRGDTFGRILPAFSKYHIHWYNWGLFTGDANWDVSWQRSSFDPHQPWFHDVLHPDGDPYDWRDLQLIRTFHFAKPDENPDPGVEVTDRWLKERAWEWSVVGPLRGRTYRPASIATWHALWLADDATMALIEDDLSKAQYSGCDGLRVRFDYAAWKTDPPAFCKRVDHFLSLADRHGMTVTPVLLTDADAQTPIAELNGYVRNIIKTFGRDGRIYSWELYHQPCAAGVSADQARSILKAVFQTARFEFPGQPLTATPAVSVQNLPADFDFRKALAHQGGLGLHGWDKLKYLGSCDASLCNYVWSLSDILSIGSNQGYAQTGWLLSIANRYGRPVICTEWTPPSDEAAIATLGLFSQHHVRWFSTGTQANTTDASPPADEPASLLRSVGLLDPQVLSQNPNLSQAVRQFRFQRIMTPRQ